MRLELVIPAIFIISGICIFLILAGKKNVPATGEVKSAPASRTHIDLSMFDIICKNEGRDGEIAFWPISEEDKQTIIELFSQGKTLAGDLLKRNPPIRIVYTDNKDVKTVRDIIPHRVIGSIIIDEEAKTKEYDFYIDAYCLLRNQERSFHTNGISAAWFNGRENNFGDYLLALYQKAKKNQQTQVI